MKTLAGIILSICIVVSPSFATENIVPNIVNQMTSFAQYIWEYAKAVTKEEARKQYNEMLDDIVHHVNNTSASDACEMWKYAVVFSKYLNPNVFVTDYSLIVMVDILNSEKYASTDKNKVHDELSYFINNCNPLKK